MTSNRCRLEKTRGGKIISRVLVRGLTNIILVAVLAALSLTHAHASEPDELKPDQRIELAWADQVEHRYRLPETLDQSVLVTIEQDGVDLQAAAMDSDGQMLLGVHSSGWYLLNEFIALNAEDASGAVIELSEQSRGRQLGRYAISFKSIGENELHGWQLLQSGNRYFLSESPDGSKPPNCGMDAQSQWQAARACFEKVLEIDSDASAEQRFWAEFSIASSHWEGGDYDDAVEKFRALAKGSIPTMPQSQVLDLYIDYALGSTIQGSGDLDAAENALQTLLDGKLSADSLPQPSVGLQTLTAQVRNRLCLIEHYRNELDKAEACYRAVVKTAEILEEQALQQLLLNNLGGIHFMRGDLRTARAQFKASQAIATELNSPDDIARGHSVIGLTHYSLDEYPQALERYSNFLAMAEEAGHLSNQAWANYRLANVYKRMGALDRARTHFQTARRMAIESGDQSRLSGVLFSLAGVELDAGNLKAAETLFQEDIRLNEEYSMEGGPGSSAIDLVNVYVKQNRLTDAGELLRKIRREYLGAWQSILEIPLLESEARWRLARGDAGQAVEKASLAFEKAVERARPLSLATLQALLAESRYEAGQFDQALADIQRARLRFEGMRPDQVSLESQAGYSRKQRQVYATEISLLMREYHRTSELGYRAEAFLLAERSKAQSLLLAGSNSDKETGIEPEQAEELQRLRDQLNVLSERRYEARLEDPESDRARSADERYTQVLNQLEQFESSLGLSSGSIELPEASIEELQSRIGTDRALWSFYISEEGSFYWQLDSQGLEGGALSSQDEIQYHAGIVRQGITRSNGYRSRGVRSAIDWWTNLLGERFQLNPGTRQLLISADGVLHYLPLHPFLGAVMDGKTERPEMVWISSAISSGSGVANKTASAPEYTSATAVVDPVFTTDDARISTTGAGSVSSDLRSAVAFSAIGLGRLAASADEIDPLRAYDELHTKVLSGLSANRSQILDGALDDAALIHFATHGILDDSGMALSGLALSAYNESGASQPWLLTAEDISRLRLNAKLAVLSACDTAGGKMVSGEGLVGLARAFQYAGVKNVLASTWKVSDRATAELIRHFYTALLEEGQPPAAALATAQQQMQTLPRWRDPYFWSGFKLIQSNF